MSSPALSLTPSDPGSLPSPSTANSSKLIRSWDFVDPTRGAAHQLGAIAIGQPVGDAERVDAFCIGQQFYRARPVCAPQASIQSGRIEDAAERVFLTITR